MENRIIKKLFQFIIVLLIPFVCVSCESIYRLLFVHSYVDLEKNFPLKENTKEISNGAILFVIDKEEFSEKNDIIISKFHDYLTEKKDCCADRVFTYYGCKYCPKIYFNYESYKTKKFGEKEKGKIFNIRIEKMPGKYKFDRINPIIEKTSTIIAFGGVDVGNSEVETLDNVIIRQDILPVCLTHFKVGKQRYNIVINEYSQQNGEQSLRDIIRNEKQMYYISDDNGNVYLSFSLQEYRVYYYGENYEEDLLPVVGVYCSVFNLLNSH